MARRKTGDKKGIDKKNRAASEQVNNVQADDHSIAFEGLHVGGDVGGDIRIGHTIGYTVEQVSVLLKQITTTLEPKKFDGRCPYKGLEVFEEEDAELFFGRERLVNELVGRVKESRTVFITGPSGSGKSSLVRAGLIHALKQGKIKSSERWLYETMKPGREPLKDLALAFSRLKSPELEDYFLAHAGEIDILNKCAESVLSSRKDQRFLLFVDQFEEIFTQINSEEERVAFINMLAHAGTVENGRVIILFAMRSDFVSNCATYPALNELLSQEFRQIGAMQPEELVSAIALPARHVGLPIEDELIARIINDMKGEPGALPLMQFALKDLFDSQQEKGGVIALTLKDYLKHGGIQQSLERHADATFAELNQNEQELTRSIFSGLIEIGRGTQDTKRTALFDELIPANAKAEDVGVIVRKLADARLIITDEQAGKDTVTIAHEKLIEAWPWLKKLVNENRDAIALQNEIASDTNEWEEHKHDASYLYRGVRLANAREKLRAKKLVLSSLAYEFLQAALTRQRRNQAVGITALAIIAISLVRALNIFSSQAYANFQLAQENIEIANTAQASAREAQDQANIALARQLAVQAQFINLTNNSDLSIPVLLAIQSLRMLPSAETTQALQSNFLQLPIASMKHEDAVIAVAFSPDGKYVLSGSSDKTIRVWELNTGKEITRMSHDGSIYFAGFNIDGKYIVAGGCDKLDDTNLLNGVDCVKSTTTVWEVSTGKEVMRIVRDDMVLSADFSPDGKYLVLGGCDNQEGFGTCTRGSAVVWDIASGKQISAITYNGLVRSVTFSSDGKYVLSAGCDELDSERECKRGLARVSEANTGKEISRMTHDDIVTCAEFSPDGQFVLSGSEDKTARVWEAKTGQEISRATHDNEVKAVGFSPDGRYVFSGTSSDIRVWFASNGNGNTRISQKRVISAVFSSDGEYIISVGDGIRVFEIITGGEMVHITNNVAFMPVAFMPVAFSANRESVAIGSEDGLVRVWKVSIDKELVRMAHQTEGLSIDQNEGVSYINSGVTSLAFSPNGNYVATASFDSAARVWDARTGKEISRMTHDSSVEAIAFSPDSKYVLSGSYDGTARVWEASTGKEITRVTFDDIVSAVAFSLDGKYAVASSDDHTVEVWNPANGQEIARFIHNDIVTSVAFSPDSKYVLSGSRNNSPILWDVTNGKEPVHMTNNSDLVWSVAFSPDGKHVASSTSSDVRVWDMATGKETSLINHGDWANQIVFSPDSKYLVWGGCDDRQENFINFSITCNQGSARVWEAITGKEIAHMLHDGEVRAVAFSPDSKYLASGDENNRLSVWELISGKEIARMNHYGGVSSIAFSPDGRYIVSGSSDGIARIWIYRPEDLITEACSRVNRNLTRAEWAQYIGSTLPYQAICPNLPIAPESTPTVSP